MTEKEKSMEKEVEVLRKAGRDRERDLDTLNTVLHCNQDIINVRTHTHTHTLRFKTHTPTFLLHCVHLYLVSCTVHLKFYLDTPAF